MKPGTGLIIVALCLGVIALMLVLPARAGERRDDPRRLEAPTPDEAQDDAPADAATDEAAGTVLLDIAETLGGEEPAPPSASAAQIHARLVAISPGAGWQLPPPATVDPSGWQLAEAGLATMRVPADWTVQNRIGAPGDEDQTVGLAPPSMDCTSSCGRSATPTTTTGRPRPTTRCPSIRARPTGGRRA